VSEDRLSGVIGLLDREIEDSHHGIANRLVEQPITLAIMQPASECLRRGTM
jgi:hypothetical protein